MWPCVCFNSVRDLVAGHSRPGSRVARHRSVRSGVFRANPTHTAKTWPSLSVVFFFLFLLKCKKIVFGGIF